MYCLLHLRLWLGEAPEGSHSSRGQHSGSRHWVLGPTCTASLGPQTPGAEKVSRSEPSSADSHVTSGPQRSISVLPACTAFWLLPARPSPSLVPGELGFVPSAHLAVLGTCSFIPCWEVVLLSSSHTHGTTGVAAAAPPQSSSGPRSHGLPASSLLFLPHPALRQPDSTYLLGLVAPGMPGLEGWGVLHPGAQPCSSRWGQLAAVGVS